MRQDIKHLLRLFGVPYVVAPSEAEAQCGSLECRGLVDGVLSDDSDCFLFGARTVFKHLFASGMPCVEWFRMDDIERELNVDRRSLVCSPFPARASLTLRCLFVVPGAACDACRL